MDTLRGSADHPLTDEELRTMAVDCCRFAGDAIYGQVLSDAVLSTRERPVRDLLDAVLPRG